MKIFLKSTLSNKRNNFIVLTLALVMGLLGFVATWSPSAEAQTPPPPCVTLTNATPIVIPAGAPGMTTGPASPYPSTINVAGLGGTVTRVTVTLNGLRACLKSHSRVQSSEHQANHRGINHRFGAFA